MVVNGTVEDVTDGGVLQNQNEQLKISPTQSQSSSKRRKSIPPSTGINFLQNMSNSELVMIHRLAGNDPEIRKTTIRKLRKWLKAIARKIPDIPESKTLVEANFGRVWKALFYCMWMADKPLPQENLAEQISNFISIFSDKPNVLMLFVEWFLVTFVREWPWIDRLRMDKFMMLIRRFLRKMLQEFSNLHWANELVDSFITILTVHLFNHPTTALSSRKAKRALSSPKAPLGFQIHVIDIFLEELAKVGGPTLESSQIMKFLSPFLNELARNDDLRLLDEIKQKIFYHLMKQSDVGIDYIESRGGALEMVEFDDDGEDIEEETGNVEIVEKQKSTTSGSFDPRAGAVDVILPQLQVNYNDLIDTLETAAAGDGVRAKNRKLIFALVRQFQELLKGQYPLGSKREGSRIPAIKRSEVEAAAHCFIQMEVSMKDPKLRKRKRNKNEVATNIPHFHDTDESVGSEDNSLFLNDSKFIDNVSDNYSGYLGEMETSNSTKKNIKSSTSTSDVETISPKSEPEIVTAKRLRRCKSDNIISTSTENSEVETYITIKRKQRMSEPIRDNKIKSPADIYSEIVSSLKAKRITRDSLKLTTPQTSTKLQKKPVTSPGKLSKGPSPSLAKKLSPVSTSSAKKKVNFVLDKNLEHEHSDYVESIQRSPAIPFDGTKRPSFGLLKQKSPATPKLSPRKYILARARASLGNMSTPRKKAADFF